MSEVATKLHYDDSKDALVIERIQDCTPILEHAKALSSVGAVGSSEMRHAASFPAVLVEQYLNTHGIDFREFTMNPEHVTRMLNDSALSGFRIWQGQA